MRSDLKPELPVCGAQRPDQTRRMLPARRLPVVLLLLLSLLLFVVPAAQASSPEREAQRSANRAARAQERATRAAERTAEAEARKIWPKEESAEFEHGSVKVTCTQIEWTFNGFPAGSTDVLEKVMVDHNHAQSVLTLFSFNGVANHVTADLLESPGRHAIRTSAKWMTSDKMTGHFVMTARITCPPAPSFTTEAKQALAGSSTYTTSPIKALLGQTVNYEVLAKNTGNVPLTLGSFVDPRCDAGTVKAAANPVAAGTTATYTCSHVITAADQTAGSYTSSASLTGTPPLGDGPPSTHATNTLEVSVPAPSFSIEALQQVEGAGPFGSAALTAPVGATVDYEILVKNTGNVELTIEGFTDSYCDEGTVSGATGTVAPGATATILCSHAVTATDKTAGSYSSTATVIADPPEGDGEAVTHSSSPLTVTVPTVAFSVEAQQRVTGGSFTTAAVVAPLGQTVNLELAVKNTGNVPLTLAELAYAGCDSGTLSGGASPLAPGASTTYLCSHVVSAADQSAGSLTSHATLTGTPPQGDGAPLKLISNTLTATVPAAVQSSKPAVTTTTTSSTTPATSGVLGFKAATIPALVGPTACVRAGFSVSVKSAGIAKVTFYLDGHKLKVLTAKNARNGKLTLVISSSKLVGSGAHKVLARIVTAQTASTRSTHATRTLIIKRCGTSTKG